MVCFALAFLLLIDCQPERDAIDMSLAFIGRLQAENLTAGTPVTMTSLDREWSMQNGAEFRLRFGPYVVSGSLTRNQIRSFKYFDEDRQSTLTCAVQGLDIGVLRDKVERVYACTKSPGRIMSLIRPRLSPFSDDNGEMWTTSAHIELSGLRLWGGLSLTFDRKGRLVEYFASYVPKPPAEMAVEKSFDEACNIASAAAMDYVHKLNSVNPPAVTVNEEYSTAHPVLWTPSRPLGGNELEPKYRAIRDADSCLAVYAIVFDGVNTRTGQSGPAVRVMVDAKTGAVISCGGP